METELDLKAVLSDLAPEIMGSVVETCEAVLQKSAFAVDNSCIVDRITNKQRYISSIGASNARFQGLFCVGVGVEGCQFLFKDIHESRDILDLLGELANNMCGACCQRKPFVDAFGVLIQSPPVASDGGEMYFPKAVSLLGSVSTGIAKLTFGFAVRVGVW